MRKIKSKLLIIGVLLSVSVYVAAQRPSINIGYVNTNNRAKYASKILGTKIEAKDEIVLDGITAGFDWDVLIANFIGVSTGLNYTYAFRNQNFVGNSYYRYNYHILDAPVRFMLSLPLTSDGDLRLLLYAGPKFALSVAGIGQAYVNGKKSGDSQDLYADSNYRSRFNLYVGPAVGLQYKNVILKGGYDFGLLNINTNNDSKNLFNKDNYKVNQEQWYIKLGFAL